MRRGGAQNCGRLDPPGQSVGGGAEPRAARQRVVPRARAARAAERHHTGRAAHGEAGAAQRPGDPQAAWGRRTSAAGASRHDQSSARHQDPAGGRAQAACVPSTCQVALSWPRGPAAPRGDGAPRPGQSAARTRQMGGDGEDEAAGGGPWQVMLHGSRYLSAAVTRPTCGNGRVTPGEHQLH